MKRFLAFYGQAYYPAGGMIDFLNDFDSFKEAQAAIEKRNSSDSKWDSTWGQVYDTEKREIIWEV
jgi:hypothetical protein